MMTANAPVSLLQNASASDHGERDPYARREGIRLIGLKNEIMPTKGDRTRDSIVASAAPIFNVKGFAGASIADILEATGLEKGGLYRHFASKDELALAAFEYALRILEERRLAAQATATTAIERLQAYVDAVAFSIEKPPLPGGCPILNTAIDADDTHAALRTRAAKAMRDWQTRLRRVVADGIASGELRADADAVALASIVTSALEGAVMVTALLREPAHMKRVAAHLHAYVDGLRAAPVERHRRAR